MYCVASSFAAYHLLHISKRESVGVLLSAYQFKWAQWKEQLTGQHSSCPQLYFFMHFLFLVPSCWPKQSICLHPSPFDIYLFIALLTVHNCPLSFCWQLSLVPSLVPHSLISLYSLFQFFTLVNRIESSKQTRQSNATLWVDGRLKFPSLNLKWYSMHRQWLFDVLMPSCSFDSRLLPTVQNFYIKLYFFTWKY